MKYLLLVVLIPFISFSQNTRKVFIETGISSFKPFVKEERMTSDIGSTSSSDYKYTYKTTPGFFIKCGVEILCKPENKFNVTIPVSIGYKEFNKSITQEGYSYGCFSGFNGVQSTQSSAKSASLVFGPKFNFNLKKFTVFTAINFNADLFFLNSETSEYKPINGETYKRTNLSNPHINSLFFSSSLQLGFDYKVSNRWSVGLSSDCYILNLETLAGGNKLNTALFNFGYGKQSVFICTGIRASYNF